MSDFVPVTQVDQPMSEDDCPYCGGVEEVEAVLADNSRDFIPCPHPVHRLSAQQADPAMGEVKRKSLLDGTGWVFLNEDSGEEYSPRHPVKSGEVLDAKRIRRSTGQEDVLWQAFQDESNRAHALAALSPPAPTDVSGEGEAYTADTAQGGDALATAKARLSIAAVKARNRGDERGLIEVRAEDVAVLIASHSDLDRALSAPPPAMPSREAISYAIYLALGDYSVDTTLCNHAADAILRLLTDARGEEGGAR